jgi:hypothetical protein
MRFWVRRRMHDESKQIIQDEGFLTSALNVAAGLVQAEVQKVAPDAFRRHYFRNLESLKYRYQLPRGFLRMKQVFINSVAADPGTERSIELGNYGDDPRYNVTGGEVVISPMPETAVEDGLHLLYVPALEMAEDDDDLQDMGLVVTLHMAVVLWAVKLLLPEGGEDNREIDAELNMLMARIPELYGAGVVEPLEVEGLPHNVGDEDR